MPPRQRFLRDSGRITGNSEETPSLRFGEPAIMRSGATHSARTCALKIRAISELKDLDSRERYSTPSGCAFSHARILLRDWLKIRM